VRAVRIDLAMRALVKAENLDPTPEEVDDELEQTAKAMGVDARQTAHESARLRTRGRL